MTAYPTPLAVVRAYLDAAYTRHDIAAATSYLAEDLVFDGPFAHCTSAQAFIPGLTGWAENVTGLRMIAAFGDNEQALVMYDVITAPYGTLSSASHVIVRNGKIQVRNGKIQTETLVFDTTAVRTARASQAPDAPAR